MKYAVMSSGNATRWTLLFDGLRSAVGEREKWSAGGETDGTEPKRNAAAEPQTEACCGCDILRMPVRDERAVCEVERASSRGGAGRRAARGAKQSPRWSRRVSPDSCLLLSHGRSSANQLENGGNMDSSTPAQRHTSR